MADQFKENAGPGFGFAFGICVFVVFLWIAGEQGQFAILLVLVGALLGWIAGILITPVTPAETAKFAEYTKGLATFVTGYLVAKLDKLFDQAVKDINSVVLVLNSVVFVMVLLFVGAFALGGLSTYVWRRYVSNPAPQSEPQQQNVHGVP